MNKEERLREYINKDYSYINYKTGVEDGTDFDKFCVQHCKDIEELLEENKGLKEDINKYKRLGYKYLQEQNNKLEERIDKAIELLQNSQIYNARSNGKTLFMKLIEEEIKILKGE